MYRRKCDVDVDDVRGSDQIKDAGSSKGPINDQRYIEAIRDTKSNMSMLRYEGRDVTKRVRCFSEF